MIGLLKEAIQSSTQPALRAAVIAVGIAVKNSKAGRSSKIHMLSTAAQRMSANYTLGAKGGTKENASRLVGVVLFLLQLEDLHQIINSSISKMTEIHDAYMEDLKTQYPGKEPIEPTVEEFLGNQFLTYRKKITWMLEYKTPETKDPATVTFRRNTQDLNTPNNQLISNDMKDVFTKQLFRLTLPEFFDLSSKLQSAMGRIAAVKKVIGQASREELDKSFFVMTPATA